MAGGVTLQVRQIGSYAAATAAFEGDLLLMQPGGLGNPYASVDAAKLVATALSDNQLGLGVSYAAPSNPAGGLFTGQVVLPSGGQVFWNAYETTGGGFAPWVPGASGSIVFDPVNGFTLGIGTASTPVAFSDLLALTPAGAMSLPHGTLSVARDPGAALEVATMGWVGNNTVASFNGRKGVVQLTSADIYGALCLDSCIATENWVNSAIQASLQLLLANHPFVFGWNGRTGAVYLTLADITCVFFQPGQQPITQTPPLTSNDYSIPNTAWVVEYIANEFAGGGTTLATQQWVLANTVNSFNGRMGPVTLTSSDVYDVGAAPLNSPAFSGIPTAPTAAVGQATGQIATTAFVQQAITNNTAGVSTFNTRTGDVVLETADVIAVGGLTNPSANLTGNPTAPTQPPGTNLPVIATCEFVQAALASGAVTSFNTRTGAVTLTLADITGVGGAPLVSPAFSSIPTAPTAAPGTATVQLATCAFVANALATAGGVSSFNSRTGAVDLIANDISAAGGLVNPSVGLTGSPTATTATAGDNSTRIATTAFVQTALSAGAVSSFNTRTGAVTLQGADITGAGGALLASPAFTGAPTAPTAAPATNNTQIATTAYVTAAIIADTTGVTSFNTRTGAVVLTTADITGAGGAPLASPSFTGVPLGPTATAGTSTTQLATTAFVQAAIASSGVSSFNARTGAVTLIANDISAAGGALLASPTFTGIPAGPTATVGTNTTQLATTAFVQAQIGTLGTGPFLPLTGGTLSGALTVSAGGITVSGTSGALNTSVYISPPSGNANAQLTASAGNNAFVLTNVTGGRSWWSGTASGGNYQIVDNTAAVTRVTISPTGVFTALGGRIVSQGATPTVASYDTTGSSFATGFWTNAANGTMNFGPTDQNGVPIGSAPFFWVIASSTNLSSFVLPTLLRFDASPTPQMIPLADNRVSLGQGGSAWSQVVAYAFPNVSDPRLKKDIAPLPAGALAQVLAIPVNNFRWTSEAESGPLHTGWMATDVQATLGAGSAAVNIGTDENQTLSLNTNELLALLWAAVQELAAKVG